MGEQETSVSNKFHDNKMEWKSNAEIRFQLTLLGNYVHLILDAILC